MKFINSGILTVALASLFVSSFAAGQQVVPQDTCNFRKKVQCYNAGIALVHEINDLPIPPSMEEVKAVLVNGNAFFDNCKGCLYESQTTLICIVIDRVVAEASKALKIELDFDVELCKKEEVVGAVKDTLGSIGNLLTFIIDVTAKALVDFGIDQTEARSIAVENLSLLPTETVSPSTAPIVTSRSFSLWVIEPNYKTWFKGFVHFEEAGENFSVTVEGTINVYFSRVKYVIIPCNERFDKDTTLHLEQGKVWHGPKLYRIEPYIQVHIDKRTVNICVKQIECPDSCETPERCEEVRY